MPVFIIKYIGTLCIWFHGIEPTFLELGLVVAGGMFYSYLNLQCIQLNKGRRKIRKTIKNNKRINIFFFK